MPILRALFATLTLDEAVAPAEVAHIPLSPIARPEDLFHDPHLAETGGSLPTLLPCGIETHLPCIPIRLDRDGFDLRTDPPTQGSDTLDVLRDTGMSESEITDLMTKGMIGGMAEANK